MKFKYLFTALFLFLSDSAWALRYVESNPQIIQSVVSQGLGAQYFFGLGNGNICKVKVTGYQPTSDGKALEVQIERVDRIEILNFDEEVDFIQTAALTPESDSHSSGESVPAAQGSSSGVGWGQGLGSSLRAGLQAGLIESTGLVRDIEQAYARIADLQKNMNEDFQKIAQGRISLRNAGVLLWVRASKAQADATTSLPALALPETLKERIRVAGTAHLSPDERITWLSEDPQFLQKAKVIESVLTQFHPKDSIERTFHHLSREALLAADQHSFLENKEEADIFLSMAQTAADVLVGLDPFTGTARGLYESLTGFNLVTGKPLTDSERIFAVLSVVTGGLLATAPKAFKALETLSRKLAPGAQKTMATAASFFRKTGNGFELAGEVTLARKVNFHSKQNPDWGLTKRHLQKHFFGNSDFALSKIDPSGSPDLWMQNLTELLQRPVTEVKKDGVLEIRGIFPKADGSGNYQMGVRLFENPDGRFDLVTVLTGQKRPRN